MKKKNRIIFQLYVSAFFQEGNVMYCLSQTDTITKSLCEKIKPWMIHIQM